MLGADPAQIAAILGISGRTANRALQALASAGLIDASRQPLQPNAQTLLYWRDDNRKRVTNNSFTWEDFRTRFCRKLIDQLFDEFPHIPWADYFEDCTKVFIAEGYDPIVTVEVINKALSQLKLFQPVGRFFQELVVSYQSCRASSCFLG